MISLLIFVQNEKIKVNKLQFIGSYEINRNYKNERRKNAE